MRLRFFLGGSNADGRYLSYVNRLFNVQATNGGKTVLAPVYRQQHSSYIVTITGRIYYISCENGNLGVSKMNDVADSQFFDSFVIDNNNLCISWKGTATFYEVKCWY